MKFLERFVGADPVLTEHPHKGRLIFALDGTITPGLPAFPGSPHLCVYVPADVYSSGGSEGRSTEEREVILTIQSASGHRCNCYMSFSYLWNDVSGGMAGRKISMGVQSCEGVEVGQALLLLFQRDWQADNLEFNGPIESPCQCAAIILASRSTEWVPPGSERLTWESGREGPRLRLVPWLGHSEIKWGTKGYLEAF
eukprot:jgi/Botrbrau1/22448/Bobra.0091s0050.1